MTEYGHYQQEIKQIIARCSGREASRVCDDSWLVTDLYIDSLMLTEMVYEFESFFQITIHERDLMNFNQVSDFYPLIDRKLAAKNIVAGCGANYSLAEKRDNKKIREEKLD